MGESARKSEKQQAGEPCPWPLCAEAQADGVPCYELGRDCAICGKATPALKKGERPERPDDEGPLPTCGA